MKEQETGMYYEIRVKGHLGQNALIWFEDFNVEYSPDGQTILRGFLPDQAATDGILRRISDLGLQLTLFQQIDPDLDTGE